MQPKNILLKTLFPIKQARFVFSEHTQGTWKEYVRMHELSVESFKRNLLGDWDLISIMDPPQESLQHAFRYTARLTRKIYESNSPCRILYADPDTLCVKPLHIFGRFSEFRLFDQMDQNIQPIGPKWDGYWSCCVRYFPEDLDQNFWNGMNRKMRKWDYGRYDYEQEMYRQMMWEQDIDLDAWQSDIQFAWTSMGPGNHWVNPSRDILPPHSIIHFGSSGNPQLVTRTMEKTWDLVNG